MYHGALSQFITNNITIYINSSVIYINDSLTINTHLISHANFETFKVNVSVMEGL